mgnify:CR=1 FL=1
MDTKYFIDDNDPNWIVVEEKNNYKFKFRLLIDIDLNYNKSLTFINKDLCEYLKSKIMKLGYIILSFSVL